MKVSAILIMALLLLVACTVEKPTVNTPDVNQQPTANVQPPAADTQPPIIADDIGGEEVFDDKGYVDDLDSW